MEFSKNFQTDILISEINKLQNTDFFGRVTAVKGLLIECSGISNIAAIGSRAKIFTRNDKEILAEIIGFSPHNAILMPFDPTDNIGVGCIIKLELGQEAIRPDISWLGRVINSLGEPIDDKGPLKHGMIPYPIKNPPPPAHKRFRIGRKMNLGVKAINTMLCCCFGQRMGIFAGTGVGKSMMISMFARYSAADIMVIGLIGERGREVQEFLEDYLGEEGLKRSVVVVSTSDESALMRKQAAYMTLAIAEYFRDQDKEVLCLMDSVTRFAMAMREIGLAIGEPPTTKGYTPSVFAELPRLLERAGPGTTKTSITGLFSVLVDGDDTNEPIADAVRGILDGHIVLDRSIAERGRFPAINILKSVSRTMPNCNSKSENAVVMRTRNLLSTYNDMSEMIRLGAYRKGTDKNVDEAIDYFGPLEEFLKQDHRDNFDIFNSNQMLAEILNMPLSEEVKDEESQASA